MKKILCIGSVTTDIMLSPVDALPRPGVLQAVGTSSIHVGGCASNAAIDLAKLGAPAALACRVGRDSFGSFVKEQAAGAGVEISWVVEGPEQTTTSVVCINSEGERSFLYYPGSTSALTRQDLPDPLPEDCGIVFVAGAMLMDAFDGEPCAALLRQAQGQGKYTVMDTAWDFQGVWLPKVAPSLPRLDLFMPSLEEAQQLSGREEPADIADFFLERGVKNVIIKLGSKGAYFCPAGGERFTLPACQGVKAVDTTGAGDAFCAGFLCGLAQGWDFRRCGQLANAVGALCVMEMGASTGLRPLAEAQEFLKQHEGGTWH